MLFLVPQGITDISVQSSVSLQHLPVDKAIEKGLPKELLSRLSFATQKLGEVRNGSDGDVHHHLHIHTCKHELVPGFPVYCVPCAELFRWPCRFPPIRTGPVVAAVTRLNRVV